MTDDSVHVPKVRVDWTVPIWGVVGLIVQGIAIVWWSASLSAQVQANKADLGKLETRVAVVENLAPTIARLDERTKAIYDNLKRPD